MVARNVSKQANALARARHRRRALDAARDEQDQRIEKATASVMVALDVRADAERSLEVATSQVGEALKLLLAQDVTVDKAAALLELDVTEVRRFIRGAPVDAGGLNARRESGAKATASVVPDAYGGDGAARRAG